MLETTRAGTGIALLAPRMSTRKGKVAIVDDSDIVRDFVRAVLEPRGYEVVAPASAFGLAFLLNKERPDLVLMDVAMPALRGDDLVQATRRTGLHRCPIVYYSDRPVDELRELARVTGAAGFIRKSSDVEGLARQVDNFITRGERR